MGDLHTSLVRLRALEPEDLKLLYTIENDVDLWDVGNSCAPVSRFVLKQYLAAQPQDPFQLGELRLVVETQDDHKPIGLLDLTSISVLDRRAEVGIALLKSACGKGYGRAALDLLTRYSKQRLRLRILFAHVSSANNPTARALFESEGYELVAVLPEWHYRDGKYEDIAVLRKKL